MEIGKRIGTARTVPISLNTLVSKISLHPKAPKSFIDSVLNLICQNIPAAKYEVVEMESDV